MRVGQLSEATQVLTRVIEDMKDDGIGFDDGMHLSTLLLISTKSLCRVLSRSIYGCPCELNCLRCLDSISLYAGFQRGSNFPWQDENDVSLTYYTILWQ